MSTKTCSLVQTREICSSHSPAVTLFVPVKVKGIPVEAVVDTAAQVTLIIESFFQFPGL